MEDGGLSPLFRKQPFTVRIERFHRALHRGELEYFNVLKALDIPRTLGLAAERVEPKMQPV